MDDFVHYCKAHKRLAYPNKNFTIYLSGGMAVKLYLMDKGVDPIPKKVSSTKDYDFVFAVHHPLTEKEVEKYSLAMYNFMYKFISGFVRPDQLKIKSYKRKSFIPASGKRTYHVVQFKKADGSDFVDCTLTYLPNFTHHQVNSAFAQKYGLPIKRLRYMYKEILTVLAGSFIYKKILPRNPLGKENPDKGQKNVARVKALRKLSNSKTPQTTEFLKAIQDKKKKLALTKARAIIREIARVRKLNANKR
jgi:hypothetical protein